MLPTPPCISNEDLAHDLNEVKAVVYEIRHAIKGNPSMGHKGLATRLDESEDVQATHSKQIELHDRKLWLASVILALIGSLALFLKDFFMK